MSDVGVAELKDELRAFFSSPSVPGLASGFLDGWFSARSFSGGTTGRGRSDSCAAVRFGALASGSLGGCARQWQGECGRGSSCWGRYLERVSEIMVVDEMGVTYAALELRTRPFVRGSRHIG